MRLASKRDSNHGRVLAAFRQAGCSVLDLANVGGGCPDALISRNGLSVLVEIKDGTLSPSRRKLRANQQEFASKWKGRICTINSLDDVEAVLNTMMKGIQ